MAKAQLDFSGARGIIDPLEGLRNSMQQASSNLGQMITQDETRVRQARQDARQDKQDLLATPGSPEWIAAKEAEKNLKLDVTAAEHDWNMKNNPAYRVNIPGTEEYNSVRANKTADEIALINARSAVDLARDAANPTTKILLAKYNQELKDKKYQEVLAGEVVKVPDNKIVTTTTTTQDQQDKARTGLESAAVVQGGNKFNELYTKYTTPIDAGTTYTIPGGEVLELTKPKSAMTPEEAHQKALKESGLLDVINGAAPVINEKSLPKVGTTEKEVKLTPTEINQLRLNKAKDLYNQGQIPASLVVEYNKALNPVKTAEQKLAESKLGLEIERFVEQKAKNYYGHSANENAYSLGEKLYAAAGATGYNKDIAAVKEYLKEHAAELNKESSANKKALVAELTAKYGHETDWFSTTGWDELK